MIKEINYKETYPLRHQVMWPDKPLDYIVVEGDENAKHYGCFENGQLISVISLFINGDEGQFRKFATLVDFQGRGYGTKLLSHLIEDAKSLKLQSLICNARIEKCDFYERFGMEKTNKTFDKGGKSYIVMKRNL